ncbi:MAG: DUF2304 family protein, partial [Bryobacteraceae bacterium]
MITIIFLVVLVLLAAYIGSQRRLSVLEAAAVFCMLATGATMVAFPDLANAIARRLNVGRGADLLLYLLALSGVFVAANFYFRFRQIHESLVVLVRHLAILQPLHAPNGTQVDTAAATVGCIAAVTPPVSPKKTGYRRYLCHLACFLLVVAIHLFFSRGVSVPTAMYDEFCYLGFGRYFSGVAAIPNMHGGAFGAFGYGLLIAPAFWIGDPFPMQFRAVLVLNAFLISSAYFPLQFLGRTVFRLRFATSVGASVVCCLYSSYLLFSGFALSDNAFVPFFLFMLAAAAWLVRKPGWLPAIVFGASAGCLYAIHSRSLGAMVAAALLLALLALRRVLPPGPAAAAMAVLGGFILLIRYFTKQLLQLGWDGLGEVTISNVLQHVFGPGAVDSIFSCPVGHLWYLGVSTIGIAILGGFYLFWLVIDSRAQIDRSDRIILGYALISVVFVFAVSLLFIS